MFLGYARVHPADLDLQAQIGEILQPRAKAKGVSRRKLFAGAAASGALILAAPRIAKAGYGLSSLSSTRLETLPVQPATGVANATATASGTAGNYGSLVTVGTNSFDYDFLIFHQQQVGGAGRNRWTVTYNNSGTDEPLITDLFMDSEQSGNSSQAVFCPLVVPKGSLIKAKVANSVASRASTMIIQGGQGDARMMRGFRQMMAATDYTGFDPTTSITLSGTTPTAYATAMAATPTRFSALSLSPDSLGVTVTIPILRIDIAIGASGSEQYLFSAFYGYGGGSASTPNVAGPFPCDIPAGSRIAYRGVAAAANTTTISVSLCGFAA